jgi:hypothetical protein
MEYETIVIPKGTVLFRGMHSTETLTSDFAGKFENGKFCIHENYNVFFYPFPFVATVLMEYEYTVIYVTIRDLKLVNLILPSKFNRQIEFIDTGDEFIESEFTTTGGIVRCDKIEDKCGVRGRYFDPCVDYTKVSGDISGMIAIHKHDAEALGEAFSTEPHRDLTKYFATYKDSRNVVGVPELILHPRIDKTERTETIADFKPWYHANKSSFNYNYLHVISSTNLKVMKDLMDEFMSEGGLDLGDDNPYHLKVNKKTGFFQIEELSDNRSELIAPNLKPTADMVFTQASLYLNAAETMQAAKEVLRSIINLLEPIEKPGMTPSQLEQLSLKVEPLQKRLAELQKDIVDYDNQYLALLFRSQTLLERLPFSGGKRRRKSLGASRPLRRTTLRRRKSRRTLHGLKR